MANTKIKFDKDEYYYFRLLIDRLSGRLRDFKIAVDEAMKHFSSKDPTFEDAYISSYAEVEQKMRKDVDDKFGIGKDKYNERKNATVFVYYVIPLLGMLTTVTVESKIKREDSHIELFTDSELYIYAFQCINIIYNIITTDLGANKNAKLN